ncbi:uncharacterized protein LOC124432753 [Vespa crabro]|uniref:uncharacterized protein LOC124432753 n=1 Tax=Vespa crabro TaxID=7445 RepID=UPI001F00E5C3|nr:uncharacterized protein LOC124432753 [Vespa crabro]
MFPFPMACQNVFKTPNVIDETKKQGELFSRSVHDGYYWFTKQADNSIAKFSNGNAIYTRPPDCIHHTNEGHEFHENATITRLSNIEALLHRYNGKCCILINEDDHVEDQKYILIGTDNSDDGSSYIEEDEDNENVKVNENKSCRYENNREESSPKCSDE